MTFEFSLKRPNESTVMGDRKIARDKYDDFINRINELVTLQKEYKDGVERHLPKARLKVLSKETANWLICVGSRIRDDLLPLPSSFFAKELSKIDQKILEDRSNPHVELIVHEKMIPLIPWWLTKTYDDQDYWCRRYALGILPFIGNNPPPSQRKLESEIKVIVLSRPTDNLEGADDLASEIRKLKPRSWPFPLFVNLQVSDGADSREKRKQFGLSKKEIKDGFEKNDFIVYYGHFNFNAENPGLSTIPVQDFTSKYRARESIQLEELMLSEKYTFLNACETCGVPSSQRALDANAEEKASSIPEFMLKKGSVFVGTLYPIYTPNAAKFAKEFITFLFKKPISIGEAIREARESMKEDVFGWGAYCLFGDPSTTLLQKGNLKFVYSPLTRHLFYPLQRQEVMTYYFQPELSVEAPERQAELLDKATCLEIREMPVIYAIKAICEDKKDWKILGPIFKIEGDVDLVLSDPQMKPEKDLEGKKVGGVNQSFNTTVLTKIFLRDRGVNIDNINWRWYPTERLIALNYGDIDAAIIHGKEIDQVGDNKVLFNVDMEIQKAYNISVPGALFVTKASFLKDKVNQWRVIEFIQRINENYDKLNHVEICKELGVSPKIFERQKPVTLKYKPARMTDNEIHMTHNQIHSLVKFGKLAYDVGALKQAPEYEDFL